MTTVRDRLWLFSVQAGEDDTPFGVPISRMTPMEAACYLGIDRIAMVVCRNGPWLPYDMHLRAMRPLKEVAWSIVDSGGRTGWANGREAETLVAFSRRYPNITGAFMDDFFRDGPTAETVGVHSLDELESIRATLASAPRTLDLWAVLYAHQLDLPVREHLRRVDVVSFWTWNATEIERLERNLDRLVEVAPDSRRSLGLYLWDFGGKREMPVDLMQRQCEIGLESLKQGRVDNLMFLGNHLCDFDLDAVEWTRAWLASVADMPLPNVRPKIHS